MDGERTETQTAVSASEKTATTQNKLRVFISYSRDDLDFADQLDYALRLQGFETTLDRHAISGGEQWKQRLGNLIREADTVVFVLSPTSAASHVCAWEVDEAGRLSKRILPVVPRALDGTSAPARLQDLNYIFFYPETKSPSSGWGFGLTQLVDALNTDLDWLREHTRLLLRATEWDTGDRAENRLLSGSDIIAAKAWAARRPKGAPAPTALHLDFIKASENAETTRENATRRALEERARLLAETETAQARTARFQKRMQWALAAIAVLIVLGIGAGAGWWKRELIMEEYYWRTVMHPSVLTREQERALGPLHEFSECALGCPTMVVLPSGSFKMGSPDTEHDHNDDEGPQHIVTFAKPFAIGKYAVTFMEWDACSRAGACPRAPDNGWGRDNRPVINVSWEDAQRYVAWLNRVTGKEYRLLSEAEWEYAARAGSSTTYYWGDDIGAGKANCNGCGSLWDDKQTAPVGAFGPNAFGLYDMHGNVWQWVEDTYHGRYDGAPTDGSAWIEGADVNRRIIRGGSWNVNSVGLRAALRDSDSTDGQGNSSGFRLARTLSP